MRNIGLIYDPVFMEHDTGSHPENAQRLEVILKALQEYGIQEKMTEVPPATAKMEQLAKYHRVGYIEKVANFAWQGGGYLDPDTIVSPKSYEAALKAAGGVITGVDQVMTGNSDSALALVRPPGHHAVSGRSMGFCLFNNVVIGAHHAMDKYGLKRIMIIDWDVHHGNGTADAFYSDPRVLYFSTHQQGIFPGTGWVSETGQGEGEGYTINVPLVAGTGDSGLYYAFTQLLEPVANQFKPELVMVSAGFDAHWADPLAGLSMTIQGYVQLAEIVRRIADKHCGGKTVLALEGGYNLKVIGHAMAAVLNVFGEYGLQVEEPGGAPEAYQKPMMRVPIDEAIKVQKKYWDV